MVNLWTHHISITLVVPVRNEVSSFVTLWNSILAQTYQPDKIIFIDGGSDDGTVDLIKRTIASVDNVLLLELNDAMPGEARNKGIESAKTEWVAFTDCGIKLDPIWLQQLVFALNDYPQADIIYGNYEPQRCTFFETCAAIAYVPKKWSNASTNNCLIRAPFIASSMVKKSVCESVGGFPDWRAAEDLIFIRKIKDNGFSAAYAPNATVYWKLRPNLVSTFKKFFIYSQHNVWAGMQQYWHYGILKHHVLYVLFVVLLFSFQIITIDTIVLYAIILICAIYNARGLRYIVLKTELNRNSCSFHINQLVKIPVVASILIFIDLAMYFGWIAAKLKSRDK